MNRNGPNNNQGYGQNPHQGYGPSSGGSSSGDGITAPYGFVPLAGIVAADWLADVISKDFVHDVPFADGVAGTFDIVIDAETPICVAKPRMTADEKVRTMYRLPDSRYAIPGSSLRGALRNVVEIASFGRMHLVNDHRYAVRDLHNRELYGAHMADIQQNALSRKNEPMPLVNAGWLTYEESEDGSKTWHIQPCHFAKIEYGRICDIARRHGQILSIGTWGDKQSSPKKYELWKNVPLDMELPVSVFRTTRNAHIHCDFGKVDDRGQLQKGTLVFTGQPGKYDPTREKRSGSGNPKHHDFFFYGTAKDRFEVTPDRFRDFVFAHSDRGQQGRMTDSPNEEWKFWKERLESGKIKRIPIFYLCEKENREGRRTGDLRAFGFAMMFRLAYRTSTSEAVANAQGADCIKSPVPDLAEAIFGTVRRLDHQRNQDAKTLTLRGRLLLSHAIEESNARPSDKEHKFVLGAPKASYYPNYVEQDPANPGAQPGRGRDGKPSYKTWMDLNARPRGWKRYRPHHQEIADIKYPSNVNLDNVGTIFKPLNKGARFRSRVVAHNLRPMELGALIWALDFGGHKDARHMLGLARPMGYGRCRMSIDKWDVQTLLGVPISAAQLRDAFVHFMEERLGNTWQNSFQVQELLALAVPRPSSELQYQKLDSANRINDFIKAKTDGRALPRARSHGVQAQVPTCSMWPTPEAPAGHPGPSHSPTPTGGPPVPQQPVSTTTTTPPPPVDDLIAAAERLASTIAVQNASNIVEEAKRKFGASPEALTAFAKKAVEKLGARFMRDKADKAYVKWLDAQARS
jgi:CRISPR-associated protein (TIGR03986 family)